MGYLDTCLEGNIWGCESGHRNLLQWAFQEFGGHEDDMAIVADADARPQPGVFKN